MTTNLGSIEDRLKAEFGSMGVDYLFPQLDIIRSARNIPSKLDDYRLTTQKLFESYQMISKWLAPVIVPVTDKLSELENQLRGMQYNMKFHLQQENIQFWRDVIKSTDPTISSLFLDIYNLRDYITQQRSKLLTAAHRDSLSELFGLVLWPFTEYLSLNDALGEVKRLYFGPNHYYNKNNVLTDSLILTALCEDAAQQKKQSKQTNKQIEDLIETQLSFRRFEEQYEWSKYKRNPDEGMFTEAQVNTVVKTLLPNLALSEKKGIYEFYDSAQDKYPVGKFLDWMTTALRRKTASERSEIRGTEVSTTKDYLIGLSFMDKHRRQEILGNISDLSSTFERILGPFHELKQENAFMQSAQFEIESLVDLPSQAWLYDFTGIETEILRSTLLLISDRQPKFDVLEACQRLATNILSGRVDRNDIQSGNYIVTNKLPPRIWNFIGQSLMSILEEALVREEALAVQLIKGIFKEEDRSKLVTSKKFIPVFLVESTFKRGTDFISKKKGLSPQTMSIWSREDFDFQYRFAQISGYPWFYDVNELLESLVIEALSLPTHKVSQLHENVKLRQTVYRIDEEIYIVYYGVQPEKISALAFKEIDILAEEGIDPVEVIFRPHKFLEMGPEKNNLKLILENARATDPKDLNTIISSL